MSLAYRSTAEGFAVTCTALGLTYLGSEEKTATWTEKLGLGRQWALMKTN